MLFWYHWIEKPILETFRKAKRNIVCILCLMSQQKHHVSSHKTWVSAQLHYNLSYFIVSLYTIAQSNRQHIMKVKRKNFILIHFLFKFVGYALSQKQEKRMKMFGFVNVHGQCAVSCCDLLNSNGEIRNFHTSKIWH